MEENQNFRRLKSMIDEIFGISDVDYDTEINNLKTMSEDNDRFIALFESEFNIDMSLFRYYDYFEEDEFILLNLFRWIFRFGFKNKKSLTISHLLKVIDEGEWFEPSQDSL